MNRAFLFAILLVAATGNLCADGIVTLTCGPNGSGTGFSASTEADGPEGCFQTSFLNATAWDALNWQTLGSSHVGQTDLGPDADESNLNLTNHAPLVTTTASDGTGNAFYDPEQQIHSVYVTPVYSSLTGDSIGLQFTYDALEQTGAAPEPAISLLIGGGLGAIVLYGRKRRPAPRT